MRTVVQRLIYRKWFYAFLAVVMWFDTWTDLEDLFSQGPTTRQVTSFALSVTGAILVTIVFLDLQRRWPPKSE